jgi:hypothetical protein
MPPEFGDYLSLQTDSGLVNLIYVRKRQRLTNTLKNLTLLKYQGGADVKLHPACNSHFL